MGKKLPLKWFPSDWMAQIKLKKLDKWAEYQIRNGITKCFDTWEEAYAYKLDKCKKQVDRAKKDLLSAERQLAKVKTMEKPEGA